MGVVYRGEHVYIGKEVAVKILHEGYGGREESIKRFLREARAASLINHPNIVDVTDFGKSNDGTVFFVMELLEGEALDVVLQRDRRLDLLRAITIVNQMAGALGAAHRKGIVHRDLKPENVMLIRREGRRELLRQFIDDEGMHTVSEREKAFDFVKILDFGVAKVREPDNGESRRQTQQGIVFGTPEYMAPETARVGISDPRTDIYALGIMFYEMLTGTVPFTGETPVDVMLKVVSQPVIPPREKAPGNEITPEAERLIMKALAKDPKQRHQTMEELFNDLQQCYGSVRYRRQLELRPPDPIQLQKVKRPSGTRPAEAEGHGDADAWTPPGAATIPSEPLGAEVVAPAPPSSPGPILLTKKKERKRTLPMEIGVKADSPKPAPPTPEAPPAAAAPPATAPLDGPTWIDDDEDLEHEDTAEWSDIDIDAR
jgi:serine/threonine-protein kinase